jgi:hypothetical protein
MVDPEFDVESSVASMHTFMYFVCVCVCVFILQNQVLIPTILLVIYMATNLLQFTVISVLQVK